MIICHAGVPELYKDWNELVYGCITFFCVHIYLRSVTVVQDLRGTFKCISP